VKYLCKWHQVDRQLPVFRLPHPVPEVSVGFRHPAAHSQVFGRHRQVVTDRRSRRRRRGRRRRKIRQNEKWNKPRNNFEIRTLFHFKFNFKKKLFFFWKTGDSRIIEATTSRTTATTTSATALTTSTPMIDGRFFCFEW